MKPTDEQALAIKARGNILVSAAAGSGKTAVLTERVIDRILNDNPVDINQLLIVTFTNAAAAEMSKRIGDALQQVINEDRTNFRAAKQKILLESASICTIDSFCNNLVKENFQQLGIKPDYSLSTDNQLLDLSDSAFNHVINEYYENDDKEFYNLISFIGDKGDLYDLKNIVKSIYSFTRTLPFYEEWLNSAVKMYSDFDFDSSEWKRSVTNECIDIATNALNEIDAIIATFYSTEGIGKGLDNFYQFQTLFSQARNKLERGEWDNIFELCNNFSVKSISFGKECDTDIRELLKAKNAEYKEAIKSIPSTLGTDKNRTINIIQKSSEMIEKLVEITKKYSDAFLEIKKENSVFDFSDIEHFALKLLVNNENGEKKQTELAKNIASRYCDVFVDEYQDTNDLQNAIFDAVSDNGKNLFTVGDVKQCIYNFRKANPKNFLLKKETYPVYLKDVNNPDKTKIIMKGNFRSCKKICDFVNYVFEKLMCKELGGMDYLDEDRLEPIGTFAQGDTDSVRIDIIDPQDSGKNDDVLQAEYIASYIKKSVGKELISDKGKLRPLEYSDFMILARSGKSHFDRYIEVFDEAGIPISTEVETDYFKLNEIYIIWNLLKVINNPVKDVSMLAVALSPLFSISPDELLNVRKEIPNIPLYSALISKRELSKSIDYMLEKLSVYRRWSATMSVSQLISRIYDDCLLTSTVLATEHGETKKANLLHFVEIARNYEKNSLGGLTGFLRYVDAMSDNSGEYKRSYTVGGKNAVRIMSVHHSKGLQAPVCFVINCSKRFEFKDCSEKVAIHQQGGIGLFVFDERKRTKQTTIARECVELHLKNDVIAEEARLLYVALTRAQNRLILVGVKKNAMSDLFAFNEIKCSTSLTRKKSYLEWVSDIVFSNVKLDSFADNSTVICNAFDSEFSVNIINADDIEIDISTADENEEQIVLDYDDINERISYQYEYADIINLNSKYSASGLSENVNLKDYYCTKRPSFLNVGGFSSSEKGTFMHRFMEKCDFDKAAENTEEEIARLVAGGVFTEKEAESLDREMIRAFFNGEQYDMIKSADKVLRESRFIYEMPASQIDETIKSDERVTVQGVADCVLIKDDKLTIIDYKTDKIDDESKFIDKYYTQLKLYAMAMNNTYGYPVTDCFIYSFNLNRLIRLDLSII